MVFGDQKNILVKEHTSEFVGFCMFKDNAKKHTGKCYDCGGTLELFELDMKNSTKTMLCQSCGMFHFYKKDFLGNYKLIKVSKDRNAEKTPQ